MSTEGGPSDDVRRAIDEVVEEGARARGYLAVGVCEYLAKAVVDDPSSVAVDVEQRRRGIELHVSVAPDDMGRIIGRRGRVAQALRTVVRAAGAKEGVDVGVGIDG